MRPLTTLIAIACTTVLFFACKAPQRTIYFKDNAPNDASVQVQKIERLKEPIVQPDDILAISVTTISSITEKTPLTLFSEGGTSYGITATTGAVGPAIGASSGGNAFLVDADGYMDYPVLGKVKAAGLTVRQVKDLLAQKLKDYVKDPVVEARIINYKVTVLGEVAHPGFVVAPNQKISILDALAASGDITITGRKDNVLIIRETEGTREFAHLNLNSINVFSSPYYYLKQNDIVYVEPSRVRRQQSNDFVQFYMPVFTTLLSTALAVYGIVLISK